MKLVNVRLNADDAAKADKLRESGVEISTLVRQAIRCEFESRFRKPTRENVDAVIADIFTEFPDPPDLPPRVDVHDRHAMREAMRDHFSRAAR